MPLNGEILNLATIGRVGPRGGVVGVGREFSTQVRTFARHADLERDGNRRVLRSFRRMAAPVFQMTPLTGPRIVKRAETV